MKKIQVRRKYTREYNKTQKKKKKKKKKKRKKTLISIETSMNSNIETHLAARRKW